MMHFASERRKISSRPLFNRHVSNMGASTFSGMSDDSCIDSDAIEIKNTTELDPSPRYQVSLETYQTDKADDYESLSPLTTGWYSDSESEEQIAFPSYGDSGREVEDWILSTSPRSSPEPCVSSPTSSTLSFTTNAATIRPKDDSEIFIPPSKHVDYLSHRWTDEEIWATWRHVVSAKLESSTNDERLENAAWRGWAQSKFMLKTIPANSVNWSKDYDITWLYGPVKPGAESTEPVSALAGTPTLDPPSLKPILKKYSDLQRILRHSLSTIPILKHTASSAYSDHLDRGVSQSKSEPDLFHLEERSKEKRVQFNEHVEQYVVVHNGRDEHVNDAAVDETEILREEDALLMRKSDSHFSLLAACDNRKPKESSSKTGIGLLPSTKLKYEADDLTAINLAVQEQVTDRAEYFNAPLLPALSSDDNDSVDNISSPLEHEVESEIEETYAGNDRFRVHDHISNAGYESNVSNHYWHTPLGTLLSSQHHSMEQDEDDIMAEELFGKVGHTVGVTVRGMQNTSLAY